MVCADEVVDGQWTDVVSDTGGSFHCTPGQYCNYRVEASAQGGTTVYQDGQMFLQTSESCSGGLTGLFVWGNSGGYFDNFQLTGVVSNK